MPLNLSWFERQIFQHRNWGPGPILDAFSILVFKTIHAAVKLGIFESLEAQGPCSASDLAKRLGADAPGIALILDTLVATGYLAADHGSRYRNSAMTRKWMLNDGPAQLGRIFGQFDDMFERWSDLHEAVKLEGARRPRESMQWFDARPGAWDRYHDGLRGVATLVAPRIAAAVKLPENARQLIDIGGSHGLYSIALCRRFPGLTATILDSEQAEPVARTTIAEQGMQSRVSFVKGDIMADEIACGPFDVALMVNTLRCFDREQAVTLCTKIRGLLKPGGTVLIADQFRLPGQSPFARLNATLILLELYKCGATTYSDLQVIDLLQSAGFEAVRTTRLSRTPGIHLVTGRRA